MVPNAFMFHHEKDIVEYYSQFSTFQKPLNKYLYIPFESFHPSSNKKASLKGKLWGMLETVLPLIHFMKQGKSSGSDYELGVSIQISASIVSWNTKQWQKEMALQEV